MNPVPSGTRVVASNAGRLEFTARHCPERAATRSCSFRVAHAIESAGRVDARMSSYPKTSAVPRRQCKGSLIESN